MKLIPLLIITTLLCSCAKNPAMGSYDFIIMSDAQEVALGNKYALQISRQLTILSKDSEISKYVNYVGQKLARVSDRNLEYHFSVVQDSSINAFALPGGWIYINSGLLTQLNSEDELAAVLGHEIGHVTARHGAQAHAKRSSVGAISVLAKNILPLPTISGGLISIMGGAIMSGYGRSKELESDKLSVRYLQKAGYNPNAIATLLTTLKRSSELDTLISGKEPYHGAFSSHPETKQRIDEALKKIGNHSAAFTDGGIIKIINGMPINGTDDDGGVFKSTFIHPKLNLTIKFNPKWKIYNTKSRLYAIRINNSAIFEIKRMPINTSISKTLLDNGGTFKNINNHFIKETRVTYEGTPAIEITSIFRGDNYDFASKITTSVDNYHNGKQEFLKIMLSHNYYDKVRDGDFLRVRVMTWNKMTSWRSLADLSNNVYGKHTASRIAIMNGYNLNSHPQDGSPFKAIY